MIRLIGLHLYPVKSLRGCAVSAAEIDTLGLVGDRRFMVVDEAGRFLTQRSLPRMALIAAALTRDTLTLSAAGAGSVDVSREPNDDAPLRNVSVWKSEGLLAEDCGDAPAKWLSRFLATPCRLVRAGRKFLRPILDADLAGPGDTVHFGDGFPFLLISEASLASLNDRVAAEGEPHVPMDRFRPNLVVTGCDAFAEDNWPRFHLGAIGFRAAGACARCVVTTTDQVTAERGREPLRTLATFRRDPGKPSDVNFGQNLIHETKTGTLRVGDELRLV
jgi:uncharacterized protein YcbX